MNIVDRLLTDQPAFHAGGTLDWASMPQTLRYIQRHTASGQRTIETGCGVSTVVFAAAGTTHTVISPDAREHAAVRAYCAGAGVDTSHVTFIDGLSDDVLPTLPRTPQYDLAFIDGAHSFPFPVVDFHYISRDLRVGGRLIVDDIPIPAIGVLHRYLQSEACWREESVMDGRTGAYVLAAPIQPEDWTNQPFNTRPDYSFLPALRRSQALGSHYAVRLRRLAGRRVPAVRRLARRT